MDKNALAKEIVSDHLKVVDVARELWGYEEETALKYAREQKYPVPVYQINKKWFISQSELQAFFDKTKEKALQEFKIARS